MKCINKKRQKLLLVALAFIIIVLVTVMGIILFGKQKGLKDAQPYNKSIRAFSTSAKEDALVSPGISSTLCVGEDNTQMEGIQSVQDEIGGFFSLTDRTIPFSNHLYDRVSPGKITQLMTALLAAEHLNLDEDTVIEQEDRVYGKGAKTCGLAEGDRIVVKQLLNAVLVSSAEDACQTLARLTSGSQDSFVTLMNEKAQELGMTNTHFVNTTGYSSEDQYTTVYDIYLLLNEFLKYPDLLNSMSLPDYTITYTNGKNEQKQKWLDSDNPFVTEKITVPKNVTVLGGKALTSNSSNYAALLTQNNYGEFYVSIIFTEKESTMIDRISEMLEQTNR